MCYLLLGLGMIIALKNNQQALCIFTQLNKPFEVNKAVLLCTDVKNPNGLEFISLIINNNFENESDWHVR